MAEETVIIEEEKEGQFTFRNMGKAIVKFKWWVIGVSVAAAVAGLLGFKFGLNPTREKLVSSFSYDINAEPKNMVITEKTTNEDLANQTLYLSDGSIFSFTDVISESRLLAVQEANKDEFGKINVSKMAKDGGIQIVRASYTDTSSSKVIYEYPAKYTISVDYKYFKTKQQGKDFISALINYELLVAETANKNYEVENYLLDNSTSSFGLYVTNLNKQFTAIKECYTALMEDFAISSIADKDNRTLNQVNTSFLASYNYGSTIDKLEGDLYHKHLVSYNDVTEASLTAEAEAYKENIRNNLLKINDYSKSIQDLANTAVITNGSSDLTVEIIKLNKEVMAIRELNSFYTQEILNLGYTVPSEITLDNINDVKYDDVYGNKEGIIQSFKANTQAWKDECDAFKLQLVETAGQLKNDRLTAGDVYGFVNNKYNNHANVYTPGVAKLEGHISSLIGLGAGLILGFVLATVICTFVFISKKEKEEDKKEQPNETK